jgi:hypothetical protein
MAALTWDRTDRLVLEQSLSKRQPQPSGGAVPPLTPGARSNDGQMVMAGWS